MTVTAMIDSSTLKFIIEYRGYTVEDLASMLNLSAIVLTKKINNAVEFTEGEVDALTEILKIHSAFLKQRIFFKDGRLTGRILH